MLPLNKKKVSNCWVSLSQEDNGDIIIYTMSSSQRLWQKGTHEKPEKNEKDVIIYSKICNTIKIA